MPVVNTTQKTIIIDRFRVADSFISRLVGLLNRKNLSSSEGLVITRCNSIHMFFMRFAIDVIFVDSKNCVVGVVENIRPFCVSRIYWKADRALECAVGAISHSRTQVGDVLLFTE